MRFRVTLLRNLHKEVEFDADSYEDAEDSAWELTNDLKDEEFDCRIQDYDWTNLQLVNDPTYTPKKPFKKKE